MCDECNYLQLLDEVDTLLDDCRSLRHSEEDFADRVIERAQGVRATVTEHEHCDKKQRAAIAHMQTGVDKWFQD